MTQLCSLKAVQNLWESYTHSQISISLFNSLLRHHHTLKLHCINVKKSPGCWAPHKSSSHLKSPTLTHLSVNDVLATELQRAAQLSQTRRPLLHLNGFRLNTNDSQTGDVTHHSQVSAYIVHLRLSREDYGNARSCNQGSWICQPFGCIELHKVMLFKQLCQK